MERLTTAQRKRFNKLKNELRLIRACIRTMRRTRRAPTEASCYSIVMKRHQMEYGNPLASLKAEREILEEMAALTPLDDKRRHQLSRVRGLIDNWVP